MSERTKHINVRMINEPCAHCLDLADEHVDRKCLFQPTMYQGITLNEDGADWAIGETPYDSPPQVIYMVWLMRVPAGFDSDGRGMEHWRFTLSTSIGESVYIREKGNYRTLNRPNLARRINERIQE